VLACVAATGLLAALGAAAALGGQTANAGQTIKLGWLGDQSGPTAATQVPYLDGVRTYFDYVNSKGGINGNRVEIVAKDDKYQPPLSITGFRSLVNDDKVIAVLGANGSSNQLALQRDIDESGIPVIGPQQTEPMQLNRANLWNLVPTLAAQANVDMAYARQKLGKQQLRAVAVYLNVASGLSWAELIKQRTERAGGQFLAAIPVTPGTTDETVQAQQIADAKPNYIFLHGGVGDAIALMRAMDKLGLQIPIVSWYASSTESVYKAAPPSITKNFVGVNGYTPAYINTAQAKLLRSMSQRFSRPIQNTNFVYGWVVGMVTAEALKKAGANPTAQSLASALAKIKNFNTGGLSSNVTFTKSHLGNNLVRPYRYDAATGRLLPIGSFTQWAATAGKK